MYKKVASILAVMFGMVFASPVGFAKDDLTKFYLASKSVNDLAVHAMNKECNTHAALIYIRAYPASALNSLKGGSPDFAITMFTAQWATKIDIHCVSKEFGKKFLNFFVRELTKRPTYKIGASKEEAAQISASKHSAADMVHAFRAMCQKYHDANYTAYVSYAERGKDNKIYITSTAECHTGPIPGVEAMPGSVASSSKR